MTPALRRSIADAAGARGLTLSEIVERALEESLAYDRWVQAKSGPDRQTQTRARVAYLEAYERFAGRPLLI
jgi:hypothetical protein